MDAGTTLTTADEVRARYAEPSHMAKAKQLDRLDKHCIAFIALSPLVIVTFFDASGPARQHGAAGRAGVLGGAGRPHAGDPGPLREAADPFAPMGGDAPCRAVELPVAGPGFSLARWRATPRNSSRG